MKEQQYITYRFSLRETFLYSVLYFGGLFCGGYLFFRSFLMAVAIVPLGFLFLKSKRKQLHKKRQKEIRNQFSDVLQILSVSLGVGSSFEKAFAEVVYELELLYGTRQEIMIKEMELLVAKCAMNQRIETSLQNLADRTRCEEIQNFQNAVALCRSSGGNIVEIVRNTHQTILQKNEIEDDIAVMCAQQKISFQVLLCMPFAVTIFMNLVSPEYMEPLFTPIGRVVVCVVLGIILLAYFLGNQILQENNEKIKRKYSFFPKWIANLSFLDRATGVFRQYAKERTFRLLFTELFAEEAVYYYRRHRGGQLLGSFLLLVVFICVSLLQWRWELLFLWVGLELAVWILPDKRLQETVERKRNQIEEELPSVLTKLAILTDAGLTAKAAIAKITIQMVDGELKKQLEQLQCDFSENKSDAVCLERFATRCRTKGTSSLATLLLQNIRKGGKELSALLRLYARASWEKKKAEVKIKGEEKAMKLVMPTMLVFVCLMVLMAMPAIMNMNLF